MTNEEIWAWQQEQRKHKAAVPGALDTARNLTATGVTSDVSVSAATLRTLVTEIERLQGALKSANDDLRDEQREAQHAASSAYNEGRHEGLQEGRGY